MLRDYQIEICERVREAFARHRSVMVQMPTGTGKTVVLAEIVREYLKGNLNLDLNVDGGRNVLIVAHRRELVEQIQQALLRGCMCSEGAAAHIAVHSIQWLSRNIEKVKGKPGLVIVDEAHHALAKTYKMMWEAWPEAKFLGLTATPWRMSGEGFTDLFEVMVQSWSVKRFIAEGWLCAYDYYAVRPDSDDQRRIDSLTKRGTDGDYQTKEMREKLDDAPCIERLFETYMLHAKGMKGIVYAIDIEHAEHIAEYYKQQGIAAYAISSKTSLPERKRLIEAFRGSEIFEEKPSEVFEDKSSDDIFENHPPSPSLPLKKGLHRFPLNPLSPQGTGDLKPGRPGLYSQTSFNCVDSRLHSAEHSSELDALLSLAREFAHKGLLVVIDAIELRVFDAIKLRVFEALWAIVDAIELRFSMRRGRG